MMTIANAYEILPANPQGKGHLGRPRRIWENNIKANHIEIKFEDMDWIFMA
jgi:hypothetical protein